MPLRYIEIDSSYRHRGVNSSPGQFSINTSAYNISTTPVDALDPVCDDTVIAKWRNTNFMISPSGAVRTKGIHLVPLVHQILPSDIVSYPVSDSNMLILTSIVDVTDSTGNGGLQPHKNYYFGAVLSIDSPAQSTRIIDYEYLGSNKCLIKTESHVTLTSGSSVQIVDPSTITDSLRSPKDEGYIFVPYGPPQEGLTGMYLIDITTNIEYTITYHNTQRNMIKISDDYSNPIGEFDELEIRKKIPNSLKRHHMSLFTDYPMTGATFSDTYDIIALEVLTPMTNILAGDFVEIQKDNEFLTGVLPVSSQNKHIDLNSAITGASDVKNAYRGSTIRLLCANTSLPYNYTSEDRVITSYGGGLASLTLPAYPARSITYTDAPAVTISGGGGSGATASAHLPTFTLKEVTPGVLGSGYTTATVTISAPTGSEPRIQATAKANIVAGSITSYSITDPGRGYLTAPTVTVTGDGVGATATATIYDGALANATVTAVGQEYPAAASSISVIVGKPDHPDGTQAAMTLTITGGKIIGITLTNAGSGYTKIPSLTIQATRGTGGSISVDLAAATGGSFAYIAVLTIDNPGSGYTSNPTVTISGAETATATFSSSIVTVDEPYDNRLDSYSSGINAIIFTPVEAKRINKKINIELPRSSFNVVGNQIHLINYNDPFVVPEDNGIDIPLTWDYYSRDQTNFVNQNQFLTGFYVAIKYSGTSFHYGYVTNHVVKKAAADKLPFYNYLEVDNDFQAYMAAYPLGTIYIKGLKLEHPYTRNPYINSPFGSERMNILSFSHDINGVLSQKNGAWPTGKILTRYAVSLVNIVLPNKPLSTSKGGYITEYPFVYVRFQNSSSQVEPGSGVVSNDNLYSNNPIIHGKTFRVIIDNTVDDQTTKFVTLRSDDMNQSQLLHFNQDLDFAVFLPDGSLFKTFEEDTIIPYPPKKDIQISALFSLIPESEL